MGSSVSVNGVTTRRPGVYADPNFSALGGKALDVHRMCIVGEFPWLKPATPAEYGSIPAMKRVYPASDMLQLVAHLLGNAANDGRVSAPGVVYLVNAQPSTQAVRNYVDATLNTNAITLKSKLWGITGARVLTQIKAGALANQITIELSRDGISETFKDVESGKVVTVKYADTEATSMSMTLDPVDTGASAFKLSYAKTGIVAGVYTPSKMAFDGAITFTPSALVTGNAVIAGTNKATGLADTETINWVASAAAKVSTKTWSAIATLTFTVDGAQTFTIAGSALALKLSDYPFVSQIADRINAFSGQAFSAVVNTPTAIPSADMDISSGTNIRNVDGFLRADTRAILLELKKSSLVDATRHASWAGSPPTTMASPAFLAGGTEPASTDSDWTAALDAMKVKSAQVFVLLDTAASRHKLLRTHLQYRAGIGGSEACGFVGAPALTALADLDTKTAALNTRHVALTFQSCDVDDYAGVTRTLDPQWFALIAAAMHSGMPVGNSLIWKRPNVVKLTTNTGINVDQDAEVLLRLGLLFAAEDELGLRIEDGLTTYRTDDNPIQSEISSNESFNTSIRDLRSFLTTIIGDPARAVTANWIKTMAKSRLDQQVRTGLIKAYNKGGLTVEDEGDTFVLTYDAGPIEPIKFILVNPNARRFPSAA